METTSNRVASRTRALSVGDLRVDQTHRRAWAALWAAIALLAAGGSALAHCLDYRSHAHVVHSLPHVISSTPGGVAFDGTYAYFAHGTTIQVVDWSSPTNPSAVSSLVTPSVILSVALADESLYLSCADGLRVVEISDPANPRLVATIEQGRSIISTRVRGQLAFLAAGYDGVRIVDIASPEQPVEIASVALPGVVRDVVVMEKMAYAITMFPSGSITAINIMQPHAPVVVATAPIAGMPQSADAHGQDFVVVGDISGHRVLSIDVRDPFGMVQVGAHYLNAVPNDVRVSDGYAYVGTGQDHLCILALADLPLKRVGTVPAQVSSLAVHGSAAVGIGPNGPHYIDLGDKATASYYGTSDIGGAAAAVETFEGYAVSVSASHGFRLRVDNVKAPGSPNRVASVPLGSMGHGIAIEHALAHVACESGLRIFDIATPPHPFEVGYHNTATAAVDVDADGNYVYLAERSTLNVLDVSTRPEPNVVSKLNLSGSQISSVVKTGHHVYLASMWPAPSLLVVEVAAPAAPQLVATVPVDGMLSVSVADGIAYVITSRALRLFDVSVPADPQLLGVAAYPTTMRDTRAGKARKHADTVYVPAGPYGVYLFDVGDPTQPMLSGHIKEIGSWGNALGVATTSGVGFDALVVAHGNLGIATALLMCGEEEGEAIIGRSFDFASPAVSVQPNPAVAATEVEFATLRSGPVSASVYDVAGRKVRKLATDSSAAGVHRLIWDGRDDQNRAVPAGVYFVRIQTPDGTGSSRVMMLR